MTLAPQTDGQQKKKHTLIVVEDDPANAEVLDILFRLENHYQVMVFRGGQEALASREAIQECKPDLFIFDYILPTMTALDLYEQLHVMDGLERVPVIVLTGNQMSNEVQERLLHLGIILIPKPYDIDDLLATVAQLIDE